MIRCSTMKVVILSISPCLPSGEVRLGFARLHNMTNMRHHASPGYVNASTLEPEDCSKRHVHFPPCIARTHPKPRRWSSKVAQTGICLSLPLEQPYTCFVPCTYASRPMIRCCTLSIADCGILAPPMSDWVLHFFASLSAICFNSECLSCSIDCASCFDFSMLNVRIAKSGKPALSTWNWVRKKVVR